LAGLNVDVIDDDLIIQHNPKLDVEKIKSLAGSVSQQIIKSEFWRLGLSNSYLCLDSDSVFVRPFYRQDFLWGNDIPYTVVDEGHELLAAALSSGKSDVVRNFFHESGKVQDLFERVGKAYAFGPFPVLWHKSVWESLDSEYLQPRSMSLLDAILLAPLESRWYGEALLRYQAIPLMPCQPLFKVYHYAWQLNQDRRANIGLDQLAQLYSGVIYQSAWEREMDWPREGGNWSSRLARRLRRRLGRS
ncbi:MAG: hypothetical protein WCH35_14785, partial [Comamonadaceae bacterium]